MRSNICPSRPRYSVVPFETGSSLCDLEQGKSFGFVVAAEDETRLEAVFVLEKDLGEDFCCGFQLRVLVELDCMVF